MWHVREPRKRSLDFGGNLNHVFKGRVTVILHMGGCELAGVCLTVTKFATSAALAEVCALLSAVLVVLVVVIIINIITDARRMRVRRRRN